ncbi:MAG TPA: calcium-binding protein [Gaiellaceae bacterium]|nr:calcium-binding protein [Gaiellaceae bacterium]
MTNLLLTKDAIGARRLLWGVAATIAVVAAIFPAQGAAAVKRHHHRHHQVQHPHAQLAHRTLDVQGTAGNDAIALRLAAGNPAVIQVDLGDNGSADFSFQRAKIGRITVEGRGGDDRIRIDDTNGTFTDTIPTRIDGGAGNDTITGGVGAETLNGGPGNDSIDGKAGNDVSDLGPGDDSFVWDPGDGSDTIEGGGGTDTMVFDGAAASETVDLSANGDRLIFSRSPANITMNTHSVEHVDFNALGGADSVTVNNLAGTGVTNVNLDLAGTLGGSTGDGQTDRVTVVGTPGNDAITAAGDTSGYTVSGLPAQVTVQHQEPTDQLFVLGVGGDDNISATGLAAGAVSEFLNGGDGNDTIAGGPGVETLIGGNGSDSIDGNGGNDLASLGAGSDTFVWDPGDGSDTIEGDDGQDTLVFNGAAAAETVQLSANGDRLKFFRNPGNITMDTHGVERVAFNALGGADAITVGDLTGTDVSDVDLNLAGTLGGATGDGQSDHVEVDGTDGNDALTVAGNADDVSVTGLTAAVDIQHAEPADSLDLETFDGINTLASSGLAAGTLQLLFNGVLVP